MELFSSAGGNTGAAWLSSARAVRCWGKSRHTCDNGGDNGTQWGNPAQISKSRLSSDCALQLEHMKLESLVIADQHAAVNTFPGLVHTARHTMGVGFT